MENSMSAVEAVNKTERRPPKEDVAIYDTHKSW